MGAAEQHTLNIELAHCEPVETAIRLGSARMTVIRLRIMRQVASTVSVSCYLNTYDALLPVFRPINPMAVRN